MNADKGKLGLNIKKKKSWFVFCTNIWRGMSLQNIFQWGVKIMTKRIINEATNDSEKTELNKNFYLFIFSYLELS